MASSVAGKEPEYLSESDAIREQTAAIRALGPKKGWPFPIGNPLVVFNIGLVGLVQGLILSSLPMAVVPGITITITLLYPTLMGWPFLTGNPLVAFNTGLVGLVSNSFFRRMLMVRQGLILSSLPMAVVPGITITLLYPTLISFPILTGDLNCPLCASMRGGLMGFTLGSVYPFLLAIPLNSALAVKYGTMKIPLFSTKPSAYQDMFSFWSRKMRYFKSQFITIAIFQTLLFSFVADRQFTVVHKELDTQFVRESR